MVEFFLGVVAGAAFAPFWIMLWDKYGKPVWYKIEDKFKK